MAVAGARRREPVMIPLLVILAIAAVVVFGADYLTPPHKPLDPALIALLYHHDRNMTRIEAITDPDERWQEYKAHIDDMARRIERIERLDRS